MPLIFFDREDLKQVQPQTPRILSQDHVIYTFPESSGLDDHKGPDNAVRHVYVTQVPSQVIVIYTWPCPESSKLQEHTGPGSQSNAVRLAAFAHCDGIHAENVRMISLSSRSCLPDQPLGAHPSNAQ
jgi:hypothetical protein